MMDRLEALINTHGTDKEVIFLGDDPGTEGGTSTPNEQGRIFARYLGYSSVHGTRM